MWALRFCSIVVPVRMSRMFSSPLSRFIRWRQVRVPPGLAIGVVAHRANRYASVAHSANAADVRTGRACDAKTHKLS